MARSCAPNRFAVVSTCRDQWDDDYVRRPAAEQAALFNDGREQLTVPVRLKGIRIERRSSPSAGRLRLVEAALEKNPVLARRALPNVRRSRRLCNFRPRTGDRARLGFRGRSDEASHALQRKRGSDVRIIA